MLNFVNEIYGFTSNSDPKASYLKARGLLVAKSKRAKEIIEKVEASTHVIDVVIGSSVGTESAFRGAMEGEGSSKLVWDDSVSFPILVDSKQVTTVTKIMGKDRETTKTVAKLSPLPAEIVLIHELGHACQYLGDLATYKTLFAAGGIATIEADNLEKTEWPVCDDYGMMRRSNYMHYKGSNDTSKWQIVS
jgi:hypothetical protein